MWQGVLILQKSSEAHGYTQLIGGGSSDLNTYTEELRTFQLLVKKKKKKKNGSGNEPLNAVCVPKAQCLPRFV